jgi:hypothetical protein
MKGSYASLKIMMNEKIDNILRVYAGSPVPVAKIVFQINTIYGLSEKNVRERLNMLAGEEVIVFIDPDTVKMNPGFSAPVEKKVGGW